MRRPPASFASLIRWAASVDGREHVLDAVVESANGGSDAAKDDENDADHVHCAVSLLPSWIGALLVGE